MRATSKRSGYSLVELVIVVAIISLIATLAFLNLDSLLPETRLGSSARDIAALIRVARHDAVLHGQRTEVVYELGARSAIRCGGETLQLEQPIQIRAVTFINGEHVSVGEVRIHAEPSGRAVEHAILIEGEDGRQLTIHVAGVTGLVTVHTGSFDLPQPTPDNPGVR